MVTAPVYLSYVRPGPAALAWLVDTVRALKTDDPLRPVTLLVPNELAGRFARWALGEPGYANVHAMRLTTAALEVARPARLASAPELDPVVEHGAARASAAGQPAFAAIDHRSLHDALLELFRALRREEVDAAALLAGASSEVTRAALGAYGQFVERTVGYDDLTRLTDLATRRLATAASAPPEIERLGALVLYLPTRFYAAEARFLAAAARWVPVHAAFAHFADPAGVGDAPGQRAARLLADALGVDAPTPPEPTRLFPAARVARAPDPAEEVREVLRAIAADLEADVPLHRMAVLYRQTDPYAGLVRDALSAAGLPWASSEGRRLHESRPGRALLGLLRLRQRHLAREAVLEWLETDPVLDAAIRSVGAARWNRLSRLANVVRGAEQWRTRLLALAAELEQEAARGEAEGFHEARLDRLREQAGHARTIARFVGELGDALRAPSSGTWADHVAWAEGLLARYVGPPAAWPEHERPYAADVARALGDLRRLDELPDGATPTAEGFVAALEATLEARSRPVGQLGQGVLVGPLAAVTGLTFERVYVLGMVEGAFPPAPPVDPFFPADADDPLERGLRQREAERQAFLTALAAADGGQALLAMPDSSGGRTAFPSRWLLDVASHLAAKPLDASGFLELGRAANPWLRAVGSVFDGVLTAPSPADLEDRRLREAALERRAGRRLRRHALARRADLPLGDGLAVHERRGSAAFTEVDGNVASLAPAARSLQRIFEGARPISATAIEQWARCPFRYFVGRVLGVEPTKRPEASWTISPLERGSLFHEVLERFFRSLLAEGRPGPTERYRPEDYERIEQLARAAFARVEARGLTGHPFAWENAQAGILADVRALLAADEAWRLETGLVPTHLEQAFGVGPSGAWPALDVTADGAPLRLRGYIDRIDLDPAGKRAFVFDYKTGRGGEYASIGADPILGGQYLQMALYTRAVRANLGQEYQVGGAYWCVTGAGEFKRHAVPADHAAVDGRLDGALDLIAQGIRGGLFPQVPGEPDRGSCKNCRFCDFDRVCPAGRDDHWREKQADPAYKLHLKLAEPATTS